MISLELSIELRDYGRELRDWSVAMIRPRARQADTDHRPPADWKALFATCPVPLSKNVGHDAVAGTAKFDDGERLRSLVQFENFNYGDIWGQSRFGGGIGHLVVKLLGTPEQVQLWYAPVVTQDALVTGFALSESGAGSDTGRIATSAVLDGDAWVIDGEKIFCSHGATAQYVVVFAVTRDGAGSGAFVVERGMAGFEVVKANEDKLGLRSWETSQLRFTHCRVPLQNRLGWDETGVEVRGGRLGALAVLNGNRPNVGAMAVGVAQAALDVTREVLHERRRGFRPDRWTLVVNDLNAMEAALQRARRVCRRAQWLGQIDTDNRVQASMAKAIAPPTAERVVRRCLQLLGPDGASTELLIEKWHRDLKILDIFEGTGQIQRRIIARELARTARS